MFIAVFKPRETPGTYWKDKVKQQMDLQLPAQECLLTEPPDNFRDYKVLHYFISKKEHYIFPSYYAVNL